MSSPFVGDVWDKTPGFQYETAPKFSAFASNDIGALAWSETVMGTYGGIGGIKNNLFLTIDGGKTWKSTSPPPFPAKSVIVQPHNVKQPFSVPVFERIAGLLWVSPSRLLIAGDNDTSWKSGSSVQLCERKGDGTLRQLWCATVPGSGSGLLLDGDYVWVGSGSRGPMNRLRLADGHLDATVKIHDPASGEDREMTACHQGLLVWGSTSTVIRATTLQVYLEIWAHDPKLGYARRTRITAPPLAGILPLEAPLCLAIAASGEGMHLDLDKGTLSPAALQVTPLPLIWSPLATASGKQPDSTARPATLARFPDRAGGVRLQFDGSAICSGEHDVFLADGDFRRWSAVPFPTDKMNWGALGGNRHRVFILTTDSTEPNSIEAVDLDGRTAVVRKEMWSDQRAVFASKDVGVIYRMTDSSDLMLTTDGGATWNATPVPFPKRQGEIAECVVTLHWVSPSRLLVSGSQQSVGLFEIQRGALQPVWITTLSEFARLFALDDDYAWVGDYIGVSLHRLRLSDGHVDATVKTDRPVVGMAVCHQALLTWDHGTLILVPGAIQCPPCPSPTSAATASHSSNPSTGSPPPATPAKSDSEKVEALAKIKSEATAYEPDSLSIWTRDAKGAYVRRAKICTRYLDMATGCLGGNIAGILPLEAPYCLLISGQGAGFRLDLDKATLSPIALQVSPPPPAPVGSKAELRQLGTLYMSLLSQVPQSARDVICKEYLRELDPTWGGRAKVHTPAVTDPFYGRSTQPPSLPTSDNTASSPSASRAVSNLNRNWRRGFPRRKPQRESESRGTRGGGC